MGSGLTKSTKKVVVIGSGYYGVKAAMDLAPYFHVIVISPTMSLYHKVGTVRNIVKDGWENATEISLEGLSRLIGSENLIHDSVTSIQDKRVILSSGKEIEFDYAVIAIGSSNKYADLGRDFKSEDDRKKEWGKFREAVKRSSNVLIVGGGAVGAEVAGEIKTAFSDKNVTIVHSAGTLINSNTIANGVFYPPKFTTLLQSRLEAVGIKLQLNSKADVSSIFSGVTLPYVSGKNSVTIDGPSGKHTVDVDLIITAGGNTLNTIKGIPESSSNGIKVDEYFRVSGLTNVFSIGDAADSKDTFKAVAPVDKQVPVLVNTIIAIEHGKPLPKPYVPMTVPLSVIPIGSNGAVGVMGTSLLPEFITKSMKAKDLFVKKSWGQTKAKMPVL